MNTVTARFAAERRFYLGAALGLVVVLTGFNVDLDLLHERMHRRGIERWAPWTPRH